MLDTSLVVDIDKLYLQSAAPYLCLLDESMINKDLIDILVTFLPWNVKVERNQAFGTGSKLVKHIDQSAYV